MRSLRPVVPRRLRQGDGEGGQVHQEVLLPDVQAEEQQAGDCLQVQAQGEQGEGAQEEGAQAQEAQEGEEEVQGQVQRKQQEARQVAEEEQAARVVFRRRGGAIKADDQDGASKPDQNGGRKEARRVQVQAASYLFTSMAALFFVPIVFTRGILRNYMLKVF